MPKKILEKEKEEIVTGFIKGISIEDLSKKFNFSKITITRNLKKSLGEDLYKNHLKENNKKNISKKISSKDSISQDQPINKNLEYQSNKDDLFLKESFIEIAPLDCQIDNSQQKDFSSTPIDDVAFPKIVYMIVDKKIELETKYLKEYPDWQFLSEEELNRKTIQIFMDLKVAKRFCNANQKVLKVPNTDVIRLAAPLLLEKGISRIVSDDKLISL